MIRFRIGQSWRRDAGAEPLDFLALEVDGVDLLAGTSEEPLDQVVPRIVEAMHRLCVAGGAVAQVSLAHAHKELLLRRVEDDVEVRVASLDRPARLLSPPVRISARELARATARVGKSLAEELLASPRPSPRA